VVTSEILFKFHFRWQPYFRLWCNV